LVSLSPKSAASNTEQVLAMSAEDLIREYSFKEASRDEHELQRSERELSLSVRSLPGGMMMALNQIKRSEKLPVSVITKCFSHGVAAWYSSLPDVQQIVSAYSEVSDLCCDHCYVDLQRDIDSSRYAPRVQAPIETISGVTTVKTIAWVVGLLSDLATPVGVTVPVLLNVGICRLIALNNRGWADGTINDLLEPEVNGFLWYIKERAVMLSCYREMALVRVQRDSGGRGVKLFSRVKRNNAILDMK